MTHNQHPVLTVIIVIIIILVILWLIGSASNCGGSRGSRGGCGGCGLWSCGFCFPCGGCKRKSCNFCAPYLLHSPCSRDGRKNVRGFFPDIKVANLEEHARINVNGVNGSNADARVAVEGGKKDKRPGAPYNVYAESHEDFSATISWQAPACDVKKFNVYVKYLKGCDDCNTCGNVVYNGNPMVERGRKHGHGCGCNKCKPSCSSSSSSCSSSSSSSCSSSSSSSCSSSSSSSCEIECCSGPKNFDEVITVAHDVREITITDLHKKAICVAVTAVSDCDCESKQSECATACIKCSCEIHPCITESDCRGLSIKWGKVKCAKEIYIYYNNVLQYTLPGDVFGASGLPPIDDIPNPPTVTVAVLSECGVGPKVPLSKVCPCKEDCKPCLKCKKSADQCSCKKNGRGW